jgi:phage terminase large subunit GpA-like protein
VKEVWYEIPETKERIEEYMMPKLLTDGRWIATNTKPTDPTSVGFWISGLYSPFRSWRDTVGTFIKAQDNEEAGDYANMTSFYNNILALPYEQNSARPDAEKMMLWAHNKDFAYKRYTTAGSFLKDVLFLTSGTDVQKDRLETEIKGWCRGGRSRSIEHYVFPCETGKTTKDLNANCWREYREKVLNTRYLREDGLELGVAFNGIDRSYIPEVVQAFAESVDPKCERVIPVHGVDRQNAAISDLKISKMTYPGNVVKHVMYRDVGVSKLKGAAYSNFRLPYSEEGAVCLFCEDYMPEYFDQLVAETYEPGKGRRKGIWKTVQERNEALDCHVYNMAMWYYSGAPGWTNADYDQHEKKLNDLASGISDKKIAAKRYIGRQTFKPNLGI